MITLEQLTEATRVRLNKQAIENLQDHSASLEACGDKRDRMIAHSIDVLLEMHQKLEALDGKS